jgi:hypothetical protein
MNVLCSAMVQLKLIVIRALDIDRTAEFYGELYA